jgi:tetratricopeptide (TPR) repeat protein
LFHRLSFTIFLAFSLNTSAQTKVLDNLSHVSTLSISDTVKILTQLDLANQYKTTNPDTSLQLAFNTLEKSEKIDFKKGNAKALSIMGVAYYMKGDFPSSLEHFQKSLNIYQKLNDEDGISKNYTGISIINRTLGNYDLALEYILKVIEINEKLNDKSNLAKSYSNLGNVYASMEEYDLALESFQKSIQLAEQEEDLVLQFSNINNVGNIYLSKNEFKKAIKHYQSALKIAEKLDNKRQILFTTSNLASAYLKINEADKSIEIANKGFEIAQELDALMEINSLAYNLHLAHKSKNDFEKSLHFLEISNLAKDSLFSSEKTKNIADLQNQMEIEKHKVIEEKLLSDQIFKNNELSKAQNDKNFLMIIIGLVLFLMAIMTCFLIIIYKIMNRERKAKELVMVQKQEIQKLNNNLEEIVKQRTENLEARNIQLEKYAFYNAHNLRRPVANILGLYNMFTMENNTVEKEKIFEMLDVSVKELDEVVKEIQEIIK